MKLERFLLTLLMSLSVAVVVLPVQAASDRVTDSEEIESVQWALYELNLYHSLPSGKLDEETITAIQELQKITGNPVTSYLTKEDAEAIIGIPEEGIWYWGAIAVSDDGSYGTASGEEKRFSAEDKAYKGCFGTSKTRKCHIMAMYLLLDQIVDGREVWLAAVHCKDRAKQKSYINGGINKARATDAAYQLAGQYGFRRSDCRLLDTVDVSVVK